MAVNISQKDKTIEHVRERLSQAYIEIAPHTPDSAIQYLDAYDTIIRWQKKGGVEDLKKALACAKDARYSGMDSTPITKNSIFYQTIRYKFHILCNHNFSNARKVWEKFNMSSDSTYEIVDALKEMIEDAEKA